MKRSKLNELRYKKGGSVKKIYNDNFLKLDNKPFLEIDGIKFYIDWCKYTDKQTISLGEGDHILSFNEKKIEYVLYYKRGDREEEYGYAYHGGKEWLKIRKKLGMKYKDKLSQYFIEKYFDLSYKLENELKRKIGNPKNPNKIKI